MEKGSGYIRRQTKLQRTHPRRPRKQVKKTKKDPSRERQTINVVQELEGNSQKREEGLEKYITEAMKAKEELKVSVNDGWPSTGKQDTYGM